MLLYEISHRDIEVRVAKIYLKCLIFQLTPYGFAGCLLDSIRIQFKLKSELTGVSVLSDIAALEASEDGVWLDGDAATGHAALLHLRGRYLQRRVARAQHQVVQVRVHVAGSGVQASPVLEGSKFR